MARKKIEEIYKEMDELTHILERPGMWVGSVKEEQKQMFLYDFLIFIIIQEGVDKGWKEWYSIRG